jgi:hypothetical protein
MQMGKAGDTTQASPRRSAACFAAQLVRLLSGRAGRPMPRIAIVAPMVKYLHAILDEGGWLADNTAAGQLDGWQSPCLACKGLTKIAQSSAHQGASHDSHFLDCPGAGGVSPKRLPPGVL